MKSAMFNTKQVGLSTTGRPPISARVVIGSLIIKHMCNLDDRETVAQITENMYMQYFLGYSSFTTEAPFDASLFVEFRNRMGMEQINAMNDKIHALAQNIQTPTNTKPLSSDDKDIDSNNQSTNKEDNSSDRNRYPTQRSCFI